MSVPFIDMYRMHAPLEEIFKKRFDEILKNSAFIKGKYLEEFENNFAMKISGKNWLDLSNLNANKGVAVSIIQEYLKVSPLETVVFGDYLNDVEMLGRAYFSYAMKNAHSKVKAMARFETTSNDNLGVEKVIAEIIKAKS